MGIYQEPNRKAASFLTLEELLLIGGAAVILVGLIVHIQSKPKDSFSIFQKKWRADIESLVKQKKVPASFSKISTIELNIGPGVPASWLLNVRTPFSVKSLEYNKMETTLLLIKSEQEEGIMVDHKLIGPNETLQWEMTRFYPFRDSKQTQQKIGLATRTKPLPPSKESPKKENTSQ